MADRNRPDVDPGRTQPRNAYDGEGGYSGQEFSSEREAAERAAHVEPASPAGDDATPPETGHRASVDRGEVHGSGAGIGGGAPGEDFDHDDAGGGRAVDAADR